MNGCNTIEYEMIVGNISSWGISNGKYYIITAAEGFISCTCNINGNCRIDTVTISIELVFVSQAVGLGFPATRGLSYMIASTE